MPPYHLLSIRDFNPAMLEDIFKRAELFLNHPSETLYPRKIMASLFFEASTRTRLSFESAMHRMGGHVIGIEGALSSSIQKGESLEDTGRIASLYADIIVMRHPRPHSVSEFALKATVPVINAGDGDHEHPTQALLDLFTLQREGKLSRGIRIGFVGDLKHGRTLHSLMQLLNPWAPHYYMVSPTELALPENFFSKIEYNSLKNYNEIEDILTEVDVLYMTRIQRERFDSLEKYKKYQGSYRLNLKHLQEMKKDAIILHPLPRVDEILPECDTDSRAKYFLQAEYGLYVRMGLIDFLLSGCKKNNGT